MPDFAYVARNQQGAKIAGTVTANSEREALAILTGQSLFPINVAAAKAASAGFMQSKKVSGQQMAVVYAQLAALLRSGVPHQRQQPATVRVGIAQRRDERLVDFVRLAWRRLH